jgi:hypothetical protein
MYTASMSSNLTPLICASYAKAMNVLKSKAIKSFMTDFQGKAKIEDLIAGTYYVCGVCEMGRETGVWNVRIDLKPGENSLMLDNKNMVNLPAARLHFLRSRWNGS